MGRRHGRLRPAIPAFSSIRWRSVRTAAIWPARHRVLPRVHSGPARALAWSPDGQVLASADAGAVHLWRPPDARHADWTDDRRLGHTGAINGLAWSPDGSTLASAAADGTVRLW